MYHLLALMALAAGLGLTVQVGMNAALRQAFGSPVLASLANFLVGTAALVVFVMLERAPLPGRGAAGSVPLWAWFGGLFGAFYVVAATVVGPRLGASMLLALTVLGQLLAALAVDHFGWLGFPQQPLSMARLAGAALLLAGVLLISR
ncbi:MAG: DMT family transporter [Gammaproteobacteria bacterium]|nr:DMT family transporter [Gammaproteobacteria bacterium]